MLSRSSQSQCISNCAAKVQPISETTKYFDNYFHQICKIFFKCRLLQKISRSFQFSIFRSVMPLLLPTGRKNFQFSIFNLLNCLPRFVPMPPLLRANAYSYIVQGISTARARHSGKLQQASLPPLPYRGGRERSGGGILLRVAVLQSIMKPYSPLLIYLYLYIYIFIYKYKIYY